MARDPAAEALAWGVDLGGTDCKVAVVDAAGRVLARDSFATPDEPERAARTIGETCRRLAGVVGRDVSRLGMGAPGPLRLEDGVVVHAPNLGWREVPLRALVAEETGGSVVLDNDANAAAFGEAWVGAGQTARVLLVVTLGTGVGGGVVVDGRVFHGARGLAGELGHQIVVPGGRRCACGSRGCVEAYFSARSLVAQARERAARTVPAGVAEADPAGERGQRILFERYAAGDPETTEWMEGAIDALARGVANAALVLDPDRIVFAGGLIGSWDVFGSRLTGKIVDFAGPATPPREAIGPSTLGADAGVIGAAGLAFGDG